MRQLVALLVVTILTCGSAYAADEFVGTWSAGSKELLTITQDGDGFRAEFFRKNVKSEYEKVSYSAALIDGDLVISFDLGDVTAKYDAISESLMLGGEKEFERLPSEQAAVQLQMLEEGIKAQ